MRRAVLVAFLLAVPAAWATPTLRDPLPFSHEHHAKPFARADIWCVDCHPMGDVTTADDEEVRGPLPYPTKACHVCHVEDAVPRAERAPSACSTCHPYRTELLAALAERKPDEDHGVGWVTAHAVVASRLKTDCINCHSKTECLDCHSGRGAGARSPHGPGYRSLHGIDARLDPASCVQCHAAETCETCHATGGAPW